MVGTALKKTTLEKALKLLTSKKEKENRKVYFKDENGDYKQAYDYRWVFGNNNDNYAMKIIKAKFYEKVEE